MVPKFVDNSLHVVSASLAIALPEITSLVFLSQTLHVNTTVLLCLSRLLPDLNTVYPLFYLTCVFPILYGCWNSPESPDITEHVYDGSVQKAKSRAHDSLIGSPSHSITMTRTLPCNTWDSSKDSTDPGLSSRAAACPGVSHADTSPVVPPTHRAREQELDPLHLQEQI